MTLADIAVLREALGVHGPIPAKKRRSVNAVGTTLYQQEMYRLLNGPETNKRAYRRHWKVETVCP